MQTEPQGDFALCCGLLIPLYAARATEEVFYGRQGVTLGTAQEVRNLKTTMFVGAGIREISI